MYLSVTVAALASWLAFGALAQTSSDTPKQLCCPQAVPQDYIENADLTSLKGSSLDSDNNLTCWYEGVGFHGLEKPFCKYTPVPRKRIVHSSYVTIPAGRSLGGGELGCDGFAPEKEAGKGPCTSSVCCPPSSLTGTQLQDSKLTTANGDDMIRCWYDPATTCDYDLDGRILNEPSTGACPDQAQTGSTCIIRT